MTESSPSVVEIVSDGEAGHKLLRNGEPYFIRGGCGWDFFDDLAAAGGNSVRTWGAATDPEIYDRSHALGLTVCAGLWLAHVKDSLDRDAPVVFEYSNREQVRSQFEKMPPYVREHKKHPALLLWGVGNEMEMLGGHDNVDMWNAVEEVAAMIKEEDPNHPVITVVAGISETMIEAIKKYCPSIDALGVNGYHNLTDVPEGLKAFGWEQPYVVTEYGPPGPWGDVLKTPWGASIEQTSTDKARTYLVYYDAAVASQPRRCLGSYVYFWGVEREALGTHTWYGSHLRDGHQRLAVVDAMTLAWSGVVPKNPVPEIVYWGTDVMSAQVSPGSPQSAHVIVRDPGADEVTIRWEVRTELAALIGPVPSVVAGCFDRAETETLSAPTVDILGRDIAVTNLSVRTTFQAPEEDGAYRLFVYAFDARGGAAVANAPFYVKSDRQS